jgi:hypothetical protein
LDLAEGFPPFDPDALRAQRVAGVGLRNLWVDIIRRAQEQGDHALVSAVGDMLRHSAQPPLRELLRGRSKLLDRVLGPGRAYDPERATTFERLDRVQTDTALALLRHGEVFPAGEDPPPSRLRASTVTGSLTASLARRRGRR